MGRIEKTVFISYRRTNIPWALTIYQNLTAHGYDVFFDYQSLNSGDFEQIIIENIRARAHFLVILTPSALERCSEPGDWLRREIEIALDEKRNIVPLFLEGFNFGSPSILQYLTGNIIGLKKYNGLNIPADYFDEAMERLRDKYLNITLEAVLHPISSKVQIIVKEQQIAANNAREIEGSELTSQEWFERGNKEKDVNEKIYCFSEALKLKPDFADAFFVRGVTFVTAQSFEKARIDFDQVINLLKSFSENNQNTIYLSVVYFFRGTLLFFLLRSDDNNDKINGTLDLVRAIRLNPNIYDNSTVSELIDIMPKGFIASLLKLAKSNYTLLEINSLGYEALKNNQENK